MKKKTRPSILASIQIGSSQLGPGPIQPPRNIAAAIAGDDEDLHVLDQQEAAEAHAAVLGHEALDQLGVGLGHVERRCGWSRRSRPA